jgi:hypothetical protein
VPKQFCVLSCPNLADHRKMKECSVLPAKLWPLTYSSSEEMSDWAYWGSKDPANKQIGKSQKMLLISPPGVLLLKRQCIWYPHFQ